MIEEPEKRQKSTVWGVRALLITLRQTRIEFPVQPPENVDLGPPGAVLARKETGSARQFIPFSIKKYHVASRQTETRNGKVRQLHFFVYVNRTRRENNETSVTVDFRHETEMRLAG